MEKKVKITLKESNIKEVKFNDVAVEINENISIENYEIILNDIKENILYNREIENKVHMIDLRFVKDVLELCTNIDISEFSIEDLNSPELSDFLFENIYNLWTAKDNIIKEYDRFVMENCFGVLANKIPSSEDMEKSMQKLSETIENLPEDKLEMISKSIVWNNMPALGSAAAPAEHVTNENLLAEA